MAKSGPEQEAIPGLERYTSPPTVMERLIEKDKPIAFGRVVMPYFFEIDIDDYKDVPESHIRAADPKKLLLPHLLPASPKDQDYVVDRVALSSEEYERIVRNPRAFTQKISNTTRKARQLDENLQRRSDTAERSELHALESKHTAMQKTLNGIVAEQGIIEKLSKEAGTPGYAHVRARNMLEMAAYAHSTIFERMLLVVGVQKNWSSEDAEAARKAVNYRLFFTGKDRVGHWQGMLKAAELYGEAREKLFHDRVKVVGAAILARTASVEETTE